MKEIDKTLADTVALKILDVIKKTTSKTINSSNVEVYHNGVVSALPDENNTNYKVTLSFGTTIDVPNLSQQTIKVNDRVKVYSDKQNLADAYIGLKY